MTTHISKPHITLTPAGSLTVLREPDSLDAVRLVRWLDKKKPMQLAYGADRHILRQSWESDDIRLSESASKAISDALYEKSEPPPLLEPTDYELTAYAEGKSLVAKHTSRKLKITKGQKYFFRRQTVNYNSYYTKPRMVLGFSGDTYVTDNEYRLTGQSFGLGFKNDDGKFHLFQDSQTKGKHSLKYIWRYFEKPVVKCVSEVYPEKYKRAIKLIEDTEAFNGFNCFAGQKEYIASVSLKDSGLIAAETGTGKSFIGILLTMLKNCRKVLLMAPKGTIKSSDVASQWMSEFQQFAPDTNVFQLFKKADYDRIMYNYGELPDGVYFTYHTAYFNGGFEFFPTSWPVDDRGAMFDRKFGFTPQRREDNNQPLESGYHHGIGVTRNGITCLHSPHLATTVGNQFDMIIIDEAHVMCNLYSQVTRSILKIQAKYKYCLTATPIPNICHNLFSLMGWLSVPNWFHGRQANNQWPFTKDQIANFREQFLAKEMDYTKYHETGETRYKDSPIISQAPRLLRYIKKTIAFISKAQCNPDLIKCSVNTIRVPFGTEQLKSYAHNLDLDNIPTDNPRSRACVQQQRLRGICADPKGREWNTIVQHDMNPKTYAIIKHIQRLVDEGEQVIHIAAFHGQNDIIGRYLSGRNISYSRIDGSVKNHAKQAHMFKEGKTSVLLMGIKCAQGHSFSNCRHLIIGSLEWSYGSFNQALGRVFRLNSPHDVNCTIFLVRESIEELMYDKLGQKESSASICLLGQRTPHDYRSDTDAEMLAEHYRMFHKGESVTTDESELQEALLN